MAEMLEMAKSDREAIEQLLIRLFPASQQYLKNTSFAPESQQEWSRQRRVADERNLRYYLERSYPAGVLANQEVARLFDDLGDAARLEGRIVRATPEEFEAMLERLEEYEQEYPVEAVEPAVLVLLNQLPKLSRESEGFFDFGPATKLERVLYRLLKRLPSEGQRYAVAQRILPQLTSLSAKRTLVTMLGHDQSAGHKFVTEEAAKDLESRVTAEIVGASDDALRAERDLAWLASFVLRSGKETDKSKWRGRLSQSGPLFETLLASCLRDTRSQTIGDVAQEHKTTLDWSFLADLMGSHQALIKRVREAERRKPVDRTEREAEAIALAVQYANGDVSDEFGSNPR